MKVTPSLLKAFFIAPFNVVIVVPGLLLWASYRFEIYSTYNLLFFPVGSLVGLAIIVGGIFFTYRSVKDLTRAGEDGTPAPWAPPQNLRIEGVYRYVRNPMMTGVTFVLFGEALLLSSLVLLLWCLVFIGAVLVYVIRVEEPDLMRRFGNSYLTYQSNVPRWWPRSHPWIPDEKKTGN